LGGYPILLTYYFQKMERPKYHIEVQMYCQDRYIQIATFDLSSCEKIIQELFDELRWDSQAPGNRALRIALMLNDKNNTKTQVKSVDCTLDELAENIKAIIKKTFRAVNFD
jgi:hypothetical protein